MAHVCKPSVSTERWEAEKGQFPDAVGPAILKSNKGTLPASHEVIGKDWYLHYTVTL